MTEKKTRERRSGSYREMFSLPFKELFYTTNGRDVDDASSSQVQQRVLSFISHRSLSLSRILPLDFCQTWDTIMRHAKELLVMMMMIRDLRQLMLHLDILFLSWSLSGDSLPSLFSCLFSSLFSSLLPLNPWCNYCMFSHILCLLAVACKDSFQSLPSDTKCCAIIILSSSSFDILRRRVKREERSRYIIVVVIVVEKGKRRSITEVIIKRESRLSIFLSM